MRLVQIRPMIVALACALPAGAYAASLPGVSQSAGVAAAALWLGGLGWGFYSMLHHRLEAEDRLARLESDIAIERDAHAAQIACMEQRLALLIAEWRRFEDCLADGDRSEISRQITTLQQAIALLQQRALL